MTTEINKPNEASRSQPAEARSVLLDTDHHDDLIVHDKGHHFIATAVAIADHCANGSMEIEREKKKQEELARLEAAERWTKMLSEVIGTVKAWCAERETILYGIMGSGRTGIICEFATSGDLRDVKVAEEMGELGYDLYKMFPDLQLDFSTFPASTRDQSELQVDNDRRSTIYDGAV